MEQVFEYKVSGRIRYVDLAEVPTFELTPGESPDAPCSLVLKCKGALGDVEVHPPMAQALEFVKMWKALRPPKRPFR